MIKKRSLLMKCIVRETNLTVIQIRSGSFLLYMYLFRTPHLSITKRSRFFLFAWSNANVSVADFCVNNGDVFCLFLFLFFFFLCVKISLIRIFYSMEMLDKCAVRIICVGTVVCIISC